MNFPLICMNNQQADFSEFMSRCYTQNGYYLSYIEWLNFYCLCVSIVNNLKNKKQNILKKKKTKKESLKITSKFAHTRNNSLWESKSSQYLIKNRTSTHKQLNEHYLVSEYQRKRPYFMKG